MNTHEKHRRGFGKVRFGVWGLIVLGGVLLPACSGTNDPMSELIGGLSSPSPSAAARDAFNVYDADVRRRSVAQLSSSSFGGEQPYLRLYRLLIDDPDATVRAACVRALGVHGGVDDVPLLVAHLEDTDRYVRWEAAEALRKIHSPSVVAPLVKSLGSDRDPDVRMAAAYALGQYTEMRVYQALVGALNDESFSVVRAAQESLKTLTGYDFGHDGSLWLLWSQKQGDQLFESGRPYAWQPYTAPPTFMDRVMFWNKPREVEPIAPKGLETPEPHSDQPATPQS